MGNLDKQALLSFSNDNIEKFHASRLKKVKEIKLDEVLRSKNPYLFRAKDMNKASDLITSILTAYLSSSEEGMFGRVLEDLAIYICSQTYGGWKSGADGIDLEFDKEGIRYLVAVKSGPSWGNADQQRKLRDNFIKAQQRLRQSAFTSRLQSVLGICYGNRKYRDKGTHWVMTGQMFWHFLSGDEDLYIEIIEPLGYEAKKHNDDFNQRLGALHNQLTLEFCQRFCAEDGTIDWEKLVRFDSGNMTQERSP